MIAKLDFLNTRRGEPESLHPPQENLELDSSNYRMVSEVIEVQAPLSKLA
jgi:hypothetical protein